MKMKELLTAVTAEAAALSITTKAYLLSGALGSDAGKLAVMKTKSEAIPDDGLVSLIDTITGSTSREEVRAASHKIAELVHSVRA